MDVTQTAEYVLNVKGASYKIVKSARGSGIILDEPVWLRDESK
jgi:hypothetical protein